MKDTVVPAFLGGRSKTTAVATKPADPEVDPSVVAFLGTVKMTSAQNTALKTENEALKLDIDRLEGRVRLLTEELQKSNRERDSYFRAYAEQQASIAVLITAANVSRDQAQTAIRQAAEASQGAIKQAFDSFLTASDVALRAIKEAMVAEGVVPITNPTTHGQRPQEEHDSLEAQIRGGRAVPTDEEEHDDNLRS